MKKQPNDDYTTVRLPKELMEEIDQIIKRGIRGYKSRSEFIKEAIRKRFEELKRSTTHDLNCRRWSTSTLTKKESRILDRTLATKTTKRQNNRRVLQTRQRMVRLLPIQQLPTHQIRPGPSGSARNPKQKRLENHQP